MEGSGFIVAKAATEQPHPRRLSVFSYIVTAKHIIDGIRYKGCHKVHLRLNKTDGEASWYETDIDDWRFHPDDDSVDVALLQWRWPDNLDHTAYPIHNSDGVIWDYDVGVGDEVFVVGLYHSHYGDKKNIPIVRIGNIAAVPEERVYTEEFGFIEAYLIEARSTGGLSGSPVFVNPARPGRIVVGGLLTILSTEPSFQLIGLMHGHYDELSRGSEGKRSRVNEGIGIVVPVTKIIEVMTQPSIVRFEEQELAKAKNKELATPVDTPE